jgi:predicted dehydrogenase
LRFPTTFTRPWPGSASGGKHLMVDKPIATNAADAQKLVEEPKNRALC